VINGRTPAAKITKQLTNTIPIVAYNVNNPVETGLVSSLARPGANLTAIPNNIRGFGVTLKSVDLLRQIVPGLTGIAGLVQIDNPALVLGWRAIEEAARSIGMQTEEIDLHSADDLEPAFASTALARSQAFENSANSILLPVRSRVAQLAIQHRLPGITGTLEFVQAGLLLGYGANKPDEARRAANYV